MGLASGYYKFKKPGFKFRQSEKLKDRNRRGAILIDVDIANDGKMLLLHAQRDYTLAMTFIHILGKLDCESETWTVNKHEFDNWFRATFQVNNKFDILKRLYWLSNAGLIEFEEVSIGFLSTKQSDPIGQTNPKQSGPIGETTPNRDAVNPRGSTRDLNKANETNVSQASELRAREPELQKFIDDAIAYLAKTKSPNLANTAWADGFLERLYGEIRKLRPELGVTQLLACWQETCDKASAKNITAPKWYETTLVGTASAYTPGVPTVFGSKRSATQMPVAKTYSQYGTVQL